MKKTVYCSYGRNWSNELLDTLPDKVIQTKEWQELGDYRRCYSATEYYKNVFVIRSPFSFYLKSNGQSLSSDMHENWLNEFVSMEHWKNQILLLGFWVNLYSEHNIEVEMIPATFHPNKFTNNINFLGGKLNISKWYRPIQPAWQWYRNIAVSEGDPMYYIRFNTDEDIEIKLYNNTPRLQELENTCTGVKRRKPFLKLPKLYELFEAKNLKKEVLKEIKGNLL